MGSQKLLLVWNMKRWGERGGREGGKKVRSQIEGEITFTSSKLWRQDVGRGREVGQEGWRGGGASEGEAEGCVLT